MTVMLVIPLVVVFYEALKWLDLYIAGLDRARRLKAIQLTLITAVIVVPINTVIGLALAWLLTRFNFKGKQLLTTLLDLPFSVSPVVAGLMFVALLGANSWSGGWLQYFGVSGDFCHSGDCDCDDVCDFSVCGA